MSVLACLLLLPTLRAAPVLPGEIDATRDALARFDDDRDGVVRVAELDAHARAMGTGLAMDKDHDDVVSVAEFDAWLKVTLARPPRPSVANDPAVALFPASLLAAPAYAKPPEAQADKVLLHLPDFKKTLTDTEMTLVVGAEETTANDAGQPPDLKAGDHLYSGWVPMPKDGKLALEVRVGDTTWKGEVTTTGADAATPLPIDRREDGTLNGLPIPAHDAPAGQPPPGGLPVAAPGVAPGSVGPPDRGTPTAPGAGDAAVAVAAPASEVASGVNPVLLGVVALAVGLGVGVGFSRGKTSRRKR